MENLQSICAEEGITVRNAIQRLDSAGYKILLITKQKKLTGIITDGDVRRWILRKEPFEVDATKMMCKTPKFIYENQMEEAKEVMIRLCIDALPVLNKSEELVDVIFIRDLIEIVPQNYQKISIPVVIMAGGKGTRLSPYTNVLPKPLLPIGAKTILERIIESFQKNGCNKFYLTLNYKKNLIKAYFDEQEKDFTLEYVEEKDFYGTCGSLSLLKNKIRETFFLSNCDVLLNVDYAELYDFHIKNKNEITAVTSLKNMQIPYGVFELEKGGAVCKISEKPEYNYQVNTGIYVMEASVLEDIPYGEVYQMTDLINKLLKEKRKVGAFPVTENSWRDMGEFEAMNKMKESF